MTRNGWLLALVDPLLLALAGSGGLSSAKRTQGCFGSGWTAEEEIPDARQVAAGYCYYTGIPRCTHQVPLAITAAAALIIMLSKSRASASSKTSGPAHAATVAPGWIQQDSLRQDEIIRKGLPPGVKVKQNGSCLDPFLPVATKFAAGDVDGAHADLKLLVAEMRDSAPQIRAFIGDKAADAIEAKANQLDAIASEESFRVAVGDFHQTALQTYAAHAEESPCARAIAAIVAESVDALVGPKDFAMFRIIKSCEEETEKHLILQRVDESGKSVGNEQFVLRTDTSIDTSFSYVDLRYRKGAQTSREDVDRFNLDMEEPSYVIEAVSGVGFRSFSDRFKGKGSVLVFGCKLDGVGPNDAPQSQAPAAAKPEEKGLFLQRKILDDTNRRVAVVPLDDTWAPSSSEVFIVTLPREVSRYRRYMALSYVRLSRFSPDYLREMGLFGYKVGYEIRFVSGANFSRPGEYFEGDPGQPIA